MDVNGDNDPDAFPIKNDHACRNSGVPTCIDNRRRPRRMGWLMAAFHEDSRWPQADTSTGSAYQGYTIKGLRTQ